MISVTCPKALKRLSAMVFYKMRRVGTFILLHEGNSAGGKGSYSKTRPCRSASCSWVRISAGHADSKALCRALRAFFPPFCCRPPPLDTSSESLVSFERRRCKFPALRNDDAILRYHAWTSCMCRLRAVSTWWLHWESGTHERGGFCTSAVLGNSEQCCVRDTLRSSLQRRRQHAH